jgi:transcriptional regulator with XRE-family HTH domain
MTPQQLKSLRTGRGWDQARLASEVGVSIHTVRAWEQGKNPVPPLVERHLLQEVELRPPVDLVLEINELSGQSNMSFNETLFESIRLGLQKLREERASQPPKSENTGGQAAKKKQ